MRTIEVEARFRPTQGVYDGQIAVASGQLSLTMRDGHPLALAVREGFWEDDCAIEATLTTDW